jgi:hypothetical protein
MKQPTPPKKTVAKKPAAPKMNTYTYKAKDGSLQAYNNSAAYQAKVGNKVAGKQAAAEKKAKKK